MQNTDKINITLGQLEDIICQSGHKEKFEICSHCGGTVMSGVDSEVSRNSEIIEAIVTQSLQNDCLSDSGH